MSPFRGKLKREQGDAEVVVQFTEYLLNEQETLGLVYTCFPSSPVVITGAQGQPGLHEHESC